MKALIQRVSTASVCVSEQIIGKIGPGLAILLGVSVSDTEKDAVWLAEKCLHLRIFEDENGKMNRSLLEIKGEALVISQFTLYGDCRHGRRPGFTAAARPEQAIPLYEKFIGALRRAGVPVATGEFGAKMLVDIQNSGPVTIMAETEHLQSSLPSGTEKLPTA
jgi:D-tyrosyl-tRNA(Tyr) deacylase